MDSLLPPNATQLEKDLETTLERATDLPVPLRDLWNPDTCPVELLPWLAWAMSLDSWDTNWPEAVKRERIKFAVEIQRRRGTVKSVRDLVSSFGGDLALKEWHQQTPPGVPHTFDIVLDVGTALANDENAQNAIVQEVDRTKPARSNYNLSVAFSASGTVGTLAAVHAITYRRLQMKAS